MLQVGRPLQSGTRAYEIACLSLALLHPAALLSPNMALEYTPIDALPEVRCFLPGRLIIVSTRLVDGHLQIVEGLRESFNAGKTRDLGQSRSDTCWPICLHPCPHDEYRSSI